MDKCYPSSEYLCSTWLLRWVEVVLQEGHGHHALRHPGWTQLLLRLKHPRAGTELEQAGRVIVLAWICNNQRLHYSVSRSSATNDSSVVCKCQTRCHKLVTKLRLRQWSHWSVTNCNSSMEALMQLSSARYRAQVILDENLNECLKYKPVNLMVLKLFGVKDPQFHMH